MNFFLRTHSSAELAAAADWFDHKMLSTLRGFVSYETLSDAALLLVQLPLLDGGLGIRSQLALSRFCPDCVEDRGRQRKETAALDQNLLNTLKPIFEKDTVAQRILASSRSVGGRRAFADPAFSIADAPFRLALLQRLFLRVLPAGTRCICGKSDATNEHINTCSAISGARIFRHNSVQDAVSRWCKEMGYETRLEVQTGTGTKSRVDITMSSLAAAFATDIAICYPGQTASDPFQKVGNEKMRDWGRWAESTGRDFKPFVVASTGEIAPFTLRLVHALAGGRPHPYTPQTASSELLSAVIRAVLNANTLLFTTVDRTWGINRYKRFSVSNV